VYRGSTVVFDTLDILEDHNSPYRYGRVGTPQTKGLEEIISQLEGAAGTVLTPSGVAAISVSLLSCLSAGDELLVADCVYGPTRAFCDTFLKRMVIATRYFDPRVGGEIVHLLTDRTRAIFLESPGSVTFELQ